MTKERFSNLTGLNSHKERTAKLAPTPPPPHFKRGGHRPHSLKTAPRTLERLGRKSFIEKDFFQSMTQVTQKKQFQVLPIGDEPMTFWLLVQMLNHLATGDL